MKMRLPVWVMVWLLLAGCATRPTAVELAERARERDRRLIVAAFQLDEEGVRSLLADGANVNAVYGETDGKIFKDPWRLGWPMAADKWTPLLALANSAEVPPPEKPTENTVEGLEDAQRRYEAVPKSMLAERRARLMRIAVMLLAQHPAMDTHDGYGATALYMAVENGHRDLAMMLLAVGANPRTRTGIYIDGPSGNTPLMLAASDSGLLREMIAHGGDVNAANSDGETALFWAVLDGHVESARVLLDAGAKVDDKAFGWALTNVDAHRGGAGAAEILKLLDAARVQQRAAETQKN